MSSALEKLRKLSLIVELIDDLIFELDMEGCFLEFYQPDRDSLYVPSEVFVGKRFSDVLPPNAAYVIEGMLEAVRAGQRPRDVDYTLELHSETRWFNAQVSVLERADGQPQSVILVCRDVTRRKRAELLQQEQLRELREAQENLRVLRGLLTICASCKSIRSKEGDWVKVEAYIEANSEACFSHGLCRACIEKLYPEDELVQ